VSSGRPQCSLLCVHRPTLGLRSASSRHCSRHSAGASPRRCAHLRQTVERLAGGVRRVQFPAVPGARAGSSGLVRWETICPAGQWCLRQDVSMRLRGCRWVEHVRTCSYDLRSSHPSSCPVVRSRFVIFVVVEWTPRGWGAAQSMRGTAGAGRRRRGGRCQCRRRCMVVRAVMTVGGSAGITEVACGGRSNVEGEARLEVCRGCGVRSGRFKGARLITDNQATAGGERVAMRALSSDGQRCSRRRVQCVACCCCCEGALFPRLCLGWPIRARLSEHHPLRG
jgi:hypothetical protein